MILVSYISDVVSDGHLTTLPELLMPDSYSILLIKSYGPNSWNLINPWSKITGGDLKLSWPKWDSFEIFKLSYLC